MSEIEFSTKQAELLAERGIRKTRPRLEILQVLQSLTGPNTVEQLHARTTDINLVTVYRTAELFMKCGLVRSVRFHDESIRYELSLGDHHHHIVCVICGAVDELPSCDIGNIQKGVLEKATNFSTISDHSLEFFGSCKSCSSAV